MFVVGSERFDDLILASDVVGTKNICRNSRWMKTASEETYSKLTSLKASTGYAVYRVWLDRRTGGDLPVFIITEKQSVLDSVTLYHRFDRCAAQWADRSGGGVYELHCYALPSEPLADADVKAAFLAELHSYFPELQD